MRNDIGRALTTDHEIERISWNRDRLYAIYIRQHVNTLRQAIGSPYKEERACNIALCVE